MEEIKILLDKLGLMGIIAILLLFAIVVERGARAAVATRDPFGNLIELYQIETAAIPRLEEI